MTTLHREDIKSITTIALQLGIAVKEKDYMAVSQQINAMYEAIEVMQSDDSDGIKRELNYIELLSKRYLPVEAKQTMIEMAVLRLYRRIIRVIQEWA